MSARSQRWMAVLRLAWRESRNSRRRLLLFMSAISAGVAALVAIDSYAGNVRRSVREQARTILGADVSLEPRRGPSAAVDSLVDSLSATGIDVVRVTSFLSMASAVEKESARLARIRAVDEGFPFYGEIITNPPGVWNSLQQGRNALADPALLIALGASPGDSVALGALEFRIAGAVESVPGETGLASAFAPRIFIARRYVDSTGLLGFGSRSDHEVLLKLANGGDPEEFERALEPRSDSLDLRVTTADDTRRGITRGVDSLGRFLGIVGLVALLLGGIGVASAIHAFVVEKRATAAMLRCLGATSRQVLAIYVMEAAVMGLVGAAVGAVAGIALQFAMPGIIGDLIPVEVAPHLELQAVISGLVVGVLVATLFALEPLLALRRVSPLVAIRQSVDSESTESWWRDRSRLAAVILLVATVVMVAIGRSRTIPEGVLMSAALVFALLVLSGSAAALSRTARALLRPHWSFALRQGVANLYRPANQTRPVILALGFGAFLLSSLYLAQENVLDSLRSGARAAKSNLVFFDIQADQLAGVESVVRQSGAPLRQSVPVVQMRIAEIDGIPAEEAAQTRAGWAVRRQYRSSYRDTIAESETLVEGHWFSPGSDSLGAEPVYEVSLDADVAKDLGVKIGSSIRWDVQGRDITTLVTSLREVDWARFEPNFFAVFEPAALENAPTTFVVMTGLDSSTARARLQHQVVAAYPNVSAIDLAVVQTTIGNVLSKVSLAVRFMAVFSLATGVIVLLGAISASRRQRIREGVLLKTLGATRAQLRRIMISEYAVLGALGSLTGMILSIGGGWALTRFVFDLPFALAAVPLFLIGVGMMALTVSIGLTSGRRIFNETPMEALRD